jgi:hypothetical protein
MGVDHTAFACFGRPIKSLGTADGSDEARSLIGKKCDIAEWGSLGYGGGGGYIVAYRDAYGTVDFDDGYTRLDTAAVTPEAMTAAIDKAIAKLGAEPDGEPGWYVGGHTW